MRKSSQWTLMNSSNISFTQVSEHYRSYITGYQRIPHPAPLLAVSTYNSKSEVVAIDTSMGHKFYQLKMS